MKIKKVLIIGICGMLLFSCSNYDVDNVEIINENVNIEFVLTY